jgi:hypothetical protein
MAKKQPQDYKKLKKVWYKKLAQSGFIDIERNEDDLKVNDWYFSRTAKYGGSSIEWSQSKADYYYMATQFLNNYKFETNLERIIWEYHSNAVSHRDITDILNKAKVTKTNRTYVGRIIKALATEMKLMYINGYKNE